MSRGMRWIIEEARRMIRANSISTYGNEELANLVAKLMADSGLKVNLQQVMHSHSEVSKKQFNVYGVLGDPLVDRKIRKGLLLASHLDTGSPGISTYWTETGADPFLATLSDNKIFGLGTADCKIDLLCKMQAIQKFREKKLKMPIYVVGTSGEELGMFGCRYLIESGALNPKYVLVGMPSGLKLVRETKGASTFRISIGYHLMERDARGFNRRVNLYSHGRMSHSAFPQTGTSAILQLSELISKAIEHGFEMEFSRFEGGSAANQVSDVARVEFYLTAHQFEDFKQFFRDMVREDQGERRFQMELGGLGNTGICFLPKNLFPCLMELVASYTEMVATKLKERDEEFSPAFSTINIGQIRQTPAGTEVAFDIRTLPGTSEREVMDLAQSALRTLSSRYPSLNMTLQKEWYCPPLALKDGSEWVQICKDSLREQGCPPAVGKSSMASEAGHFFKKGYEVLAFGPAPAEKNSHSPNEHCLLDEIEKAIGFYETVIEKTCI